MALQASGQITYNDINVELKKSATSQFAFNDTDARALAGITTPGAQISIADFYGKSSLTPFSAYNFAVPGVDSGGGGPVSAGGTVRPLTGGSVSVSYALTLRRYWANSSGSQTYQAPVDAVFVSPGTNWTDTDFVTMGITVTDVRTTTRNINVGIVTDVDHDGYWGYYIVTRAGTPTLGTWATGAWTQWTSTVQGASGRQRNVNMGTHSLPTPNNDQLIVLAYADGRGQNNIRYTLT